MAKYLLVYHGGGRPESDAEIQQVMAAWGAWFEKLGKAAVDPGNPVGQSHTVQSNGHVTKDGGANPVSGYTVLEASSQNEAEDMAKGCPILEAGGTIEVAEIVEM